MKPHWKQFFAREKTLFVRVAIVSLTISFLPLLIYQWISIQNSFSILKQTYTNELKNKTELTSLLITQGISKKESEIKTISKTTNFNDLSNQNARKEIRDFLEISQDIISISLLNSEGKILNSTTSEFSGKNLETLYSVTISKYFNKHNKSLLYNQVLVSDVEFINGEGVVFMFAPIDKNLKDYMAIEMNLRTIELLLLSFQDDIEGGKYATILDRDGKVLFSFDPNSKKGQEFADLSHIPDTSEDENTFVEYIDQYGDEVISVTETLPTFGSSNSLGWRLVTTVPIDVIYDKSLQSLEIIIIIGIIIIIVTVLISFMLTSSITKPIEKIVLMAQKIHQGDYSIRLNEEKGIKEIYQLEKTLNEMTARIESDTNELLAQNEYINLILDSSPVFIMASTKGEIDFFNKTFLNYLGFSTQEEILHSDLKLNTIFLKINELKISTESNSEIYNILKENIQSVVYLRDYHNLKSPPLVASTSYFEKFRRRIYTFTDVSNIESQKSVLTEKVKTTIEENKKQQEMLQLQTRHAQMGEMIGAIAHQWKQPLNILAVTSFQLHDDYSHQEVDEEYVKKYVDNTQNTIRYMNSTINDFRDFFKPSKTPTPFSPLKTIENIEKMLGKRYQNEKINLSIKGDFELKILGKANEFQQVIINIFNNSVDAFNEQEISDRSIEVNVSLDNSDVLIEIEDNAQGIPEKIIDNIFDSYFTTKSEDKGTGIGLYMSKIIIEENMEGSLKVANTQKGAKFSMRFKKVSF